MAQRTISNTGGNFNSASTWVEGIAPTTSDFVVATATSGQLTVTLSATVQYIDLTLYTNTLTINSGVNLSFGTVASSTSVINAGSYNFLGTGTTQGSLSVVTAVSRTLTQVVGSPVVPRLQISGGVLTLGSNINALNLTLQNTNTIINGNNLNISGDLRFTNTSYTSFSGSTILNLVGTGTIYQTSTVGLSIATNINTSGTITFPDNGLVITNGTFGNIGLIYTNGTVIRPRLTISHYGQTTNDFIVNDLSGLIFDSITLASNMGNNIALKSTLRLSSVLRAKVIYTTFDLTLIPLLPGNSSGDISGWTFYNNKIVCDELIVNTVPVRQSLSSTYASTSFDYKYYKASIFELDPVYTHDIGNISLSGYGVTDTTYLPRLRSRTAGTQVTINLTDGTKSFVTLSSITDVNVTTNTLKTLWSTLSNTNNITNFTSIGGGGTSVSGGAWTFVN